MFSTPLEWIRYILYTFSGDHSFINEVSEDAVINRAHAMLKLLEKRGDDKGPFYIRLKKHLENYAEDVLLNRSV